MVPIERCWMRLLKDILINLDDEGGTNVNGEFSYSHCPLYLVHPEKRGIWVVLGGFENPCGKGVNMMNLLNGIREEWAYETFVIKIIKLAIMVEELEQVPDPF
jgi:hypothetical protein